MIAEGTPAEVVLEALRETEQLDAELTQQRRHELRIVWTIRLCMFGQVTCAALCAAVLSNGYAMTWGSVVVFGLAVWVFVNALLPAERRWAAFRKRHENLRDRLQRLTDELVRALKGPLVNEQPEKE